MRFDNQRSVFLILAATLFALGGCRPGAPGAGAVDSVTAAARGDSSTRSSATAPSARSDSVVLRTDKSQYRAGDRITLTVSDDGRGFDPAVVGQSVADGHIGLGSLLARFDAMGGAMDIDSASSGTTVTVTSPPEPATSSSALER